MNVNVYIVPYSILTIKYSVFEKLSFFACKLYNYQNGEKRTHLTMDVIVDELRKSNVNIDRTILSQHIHDILDRYQDMYDQMADRISANELTSVYKGVKADTAGRIMAYLALVYRMNISREDTVREATRMVVPALRNLAKDEGISITRNIPKDEGSFIQRICTGVGYALYSCNITRGYHL